MTLIDPDATICYQTPSVESVLGYAPAELVGVKLTELLHSDDVTRAIAFFTEAMRQPGITSTVEWRMQHRDGSWLHIETVGNNLIDDPNVGQMILNSRDITERKALEEQLAHQAFHDPLTDLANRALLKDRVDRALRERRRSEEPFAILFCDLDNFKNVNDSLGHQVGDELLVGVGERLRACVRPADTVSRLGGDEFAIPLEDATTISNAVVVAERITESLQEPFTLQGKQAFIDTSIGIDSQEAAFVRTIIELCRTLELETIAEGVESAEQAYELRKLGSEPGQGDYLAKPLTEEEMTVLLRHGRELGRCAREVRSTRERREADWWKRALGGETSAAPAA